MLKILTIFGTRPEAIKMAPLIKELQNHPGCFDCRVAVTAQHRQMLDQVLDLFGIVPRHDLNIMQPGQSLFDITRRALAGLEQVLSAEQPDLVLVHGDTTTTFTGALAAFYRRIPVGHVEAGLRTGNKFSPFPEEINRHLTGVLADIHFAPTAAARANLLREGVAEKDIFVTGNTVIDALLATVRREFAFTDPVLSNIDYARQRVLLVTTHRRENLGEPMREIYLALRQVVQDYPDVTVIFPVHKNPAVRQVVREVLGEAPRVHLIEPLDYQPFVNLMQRSYLVLTDSGGLQEEAPALGKPVLVLRDTTERPEAVEAGTVRLVGTVREAVLTETRRLLDDPVHYRRMAEAVNPYGDGQACRRIAAAIAWHFDLAEAPPDEFSPR
ncbi:non-hydrolyzing UDP-N-acetylglucosamine 2-epimerase [Desulfotomaculum copahuensis]|uniref:UDP-N-acetylglucosamine 2-epimerase (non-hydrolyzing) n=1 Tax=Desulfotomaculum copahuensis TaxID=1838280 RepID=A0A1B7LBB3_9FIRM|nr:UDP-N-acetylglucosamine 2-epimerase (non-hydrolyzing) [Desulfotomaculum copahuensis]OAT79778.1 UDP-N-acetylglucosamine 2-epimerase [Desulfotomaculum copahuensis]